MSDPKHTELRSALLKAEPFSESEKHSRYQTEVEKIMEQETKRVLSEKRMIQWMWPFIVILSTAFLLLGGSADDPTQKLWFGILACFWFSFGGIFVLRYFMNRNKLELMRELKSIQLQLADLQTKSGQS